MNGLRSLLAAAILGVSVLGLLPGAAAAGGAVYCGDTNTFNNGHSSSVQHPGYFYAVLYRDQNFGGNCLGFNSSQTYLGYWTDGGDRSWNDTVTSMKFGANNCHYGENFYFNSGYDSQFPAYGHLSSPNSGYVGFSNLPAAENDSMSSVKVTLANSCPG